MEKLIDLKRGKETGGYEKPKYRLESVSKRDMAIIGVSGRIGSAESVGEFWECLRAGKDFIRPLPEYRKKDTEAYTSALKQVGRFDEGIDFYEAAYMDRIDDFDCSLFSISPKEADLMDPNQRLLLQAVWEGIEDAGYGGGRLAGSRTGIFTGYSTDFGEEYKTYSMIVSGADDEAAVTGNIRSIIGSRISYLLDLKGPSVMVDTACSSALVAVHLACQAIRNGECDMAIAGGIKLIIAPLMGKNGQGNIGILSPRRKAWTFDDSSDGTGLGEGVGVIILKPLSKAMEDGDNIYAVIKGSAVNQDGSSIGITAPNMAAQEDVIIRAWKDANVEPETISYIEAHGTATKLGDPIEVTGIKRAFQNYTDRKQFCAVASVKTNTGHLDHAAGIASLLKAVMALKHGELPPSIHFSRPNRKISFEDSPVYVNDRLTKWESSGAPRRCGISSFGLSGTNCHLVLEEYIKPQNSETEKESNADRANIITLSAKSRDALDRLIERYDHFLVQCVQQDFEDICHTANTGRGHYGFRLAVIASSLEELRGKIKKLAEKGVENTEEEEGVFFGEHKTVAPTKEVKQEGEITDDEKKQLRSRADSITGLLLPGTGAEQRKNILGQIIGLYIKGADVEWEKLYPSSRHKKVSIPSYPFLRERHWVKPRKWAVLPGRAIGEGIGHPILDTRLVESMGLEIYSTRFSVDRHWVLNEHKVAGSYVVPGTTYIEMVREIASRSNPGGVIELSDVMFLFPLIAKEGIEVEAQTVVRDEGAYKAFTIVSKSGMGESWIKHVEGKFSVTGSKDQPKYEINELKKRFSGYEDIYYEDETAEVVDTGPRFKNLKKVYTGTDELLAYLELPQRFNDDLGEFMLHPALMDTAVNMANSSIGEGLYLPFSYRKLKVYGKMPGKIYCHMVREQKQKANMETGVCDISLMDVNGQVFARIEGYTVKKVHTEELKTFDRGVKELGFYDTGWVKKSFEGPKDELHEGTALIIKGKSGISADVIMRLKEKGLQVYEVELGRNYEAVDSHKFIVSSDEGDYSRVLSAIHGKLTHVLHMASIQAAEGINTVRELDSVTDKGVNDLFRLVRALINAKQNNIELILISDNANEVSGSETQINPHNAALFALGRVIGNEYPGLRCRCLDIDEYAAPEDIINEMEARDTSLLAAYRSKARYLEEFKKIDFKGLERQEMAIKSEGVYVITGGAGGIGLEIARTLSLKAKVNLCFINRSSMPEHDTWESILNKNEDLKLCKRIRTIREIEKTGAAVLCCSADVSNMDAVQGILASLRKEFGRINGIVHAAGIAGDGFIIRKSDEVWRGVLAPKISGTWILDTLTREDRLDFFVLFSSISSLTATPGQGDYTAANAYLDSFAKFRSKRGQRTLTINWPAWRETGMAVDYGAVNDELLFKPISTSAACSAFLELLSFMPARAIPAELNYQVLELAENEVPFIVSEEIRTETERGKNRRNRAGTQENKDISGIDVKLMGKTGKAYTGTEQELAKMWALVLGINEVDIYDNFSSLGGDSILATNLLKEMQKKYDGWVDISDVFTYSTISEMAGFIDSKMNTEIEFEKIDEAGDEQDSELDDILERLARGDMSVEEAEKLIEVGDE
ncbi:MAG: SDR family NAD(P)-dependent oxidoreductase [Clostridia bacterium]|nr:SDR family NAD(P)-dependent oxidoreductase [Clostridia bacterium]